MLRAAVVIALSLLVAGGALAQESPEFDKCMKSGKRFVDEQKYEQALGEFQKAHRTKPHSKGAVFNMAYCLMKLNRLEESLARFEAYVGMNPGRSKAQKARLFVDQISTELARNRALVTVEADPGDVTVYLDGQEVPQSGSTPMSFWSRPGKRILDLKRPGYHDFSKEFMATAGKEITLNISLVKKEDGLTIEGGNGKGRKVDPAGGPGPGPYITMGLGGAVAVGGGVLCIMSKSDFDDVNASDDPDSPENETKWNDAVDRAYIGYALMGVGGAALVGGVVWAIAAGPDSEASTSFNVVPTPGGAAGTFGFTF